MDKKLKDLDRDFLRIRDLVRLTGLSKSKLHRLVADGRLRAIRVDSCLLVSAQSYKKLFSR